MEINVKEAEGVEYTAILIEEKKNKLNKKKKKKTNKKYMKKEGVFE